MNAEEQAVVTNDKIPEPKKDPGYSKVGGWLAWLCLGLVFGVPVVYVTNIVADYKGMRALFQLYPRVQIVFWMNTVQMAGIAIFSIVAGCMLYTLNKNAPKIARIFLLTLFGSVVLYGVSYLLAGLPPSFNKAFSGLIGTQILRQAFASGVWYAYLLVSKRVKRTYGDAVDASAGPAESAGVEEVFHRKRIACPQCRLSEDVPYNKIYEPAQYTKFSARVKRSFGFLNLKLTCRSCGKEFKYEDVP